MQKYDVHTHFLLSNASAKAWSNLIEVQAKLNLNQTWPKENMNLACYTKLHTFHGLSGVVLMKTLN